MTLEKAIDVLEILSTIKWDFFGTSERDAINLGIEALKERIEAIEQGLPLWHELLPGETKE